MVPPKEMEKLVRYYKGELTENAWLNKAARTAAKRDLLLKSKLPAGVIKAKVKPLSRELHHLTKRVRRGPVGGLGGQLEEDEDDEEDDSLVTGPMEQVVKRLIKATPSKKAIQKEIVKEVKKEIQTPSSAPPKSVSTAKSTKPSFSAKKTLRQQTEELRQKVRARRQTELEKLKTVPGWTIWDKPVKRKLKDDF